MPFLGPEVEESLRDTRNTLRESGQAVKHSQVLIDISRADLIQLRQTIESGEERLSAGRRKLWAIKDVGRYSFDPP
jgi:hypothetical protein